MGLMSGEIGHQGSRAMVPLFTVIIPTFNRQELLDEAVGSVLVQTISDFECVVIDDASPEPTQVPSDPRIRLIRLEENRGCAAARNVGIANAKGRYICFLDDDDTFVPNRLELALDGLRRAPMAICWRSGDGSSCRRTLEGDVHDWILDDLTPHLGQTAIDRTQVRAFDESYEAVEDVEWWLRMTESLRVATVPQIGCHVRAHSGARNRNGIEARSTYSRRLLEDYAPYFDAHPRAAAFRWKRVGRLAVTTGDRDLARRAFVASMRRHPAPKTLGLLVRSLVPTRRGTVAGQPPTQQATRNAGGPTA